MAETWDDLEDFEEWSPEKGISFAGHALAGSIAGTAEHCLIFPMDTIRTHLQAEGTQRGAIKELIAKEGFGRLWRGVSTMLIATIPAHALYFTSYEQSKVVFGADDEENHTPMAAAACGAVATLGHDAIMTPMDVIKQRLQLGLHGGIKDCAKSIVRSEGPWAFFRSLPTTLVMNVPFASIMVAANESCKKILNPKGEYNLPAFLASGAIAGAVAAAATTPLDVIKTRLQTQSVMHEIAQQRMSRCRAEGGGNGPPPGSFQAKSALRGFGSRISSGMNSFVGSGGSGVARPSFGAAAPFYSNAVRSPKSPPLTKGTTTLLFKSAPGQPRANLSTVRYHGFFDTAKSILETEGPRGFTRGLKPRILVFAPSVAISWSTYETAKSALTGYL
mmetsp:Transcript_12412/g.22129  ORF Transcript_12412/g.22129 Transcript_12412/m.22129 type:complete len:389 (-) Transcript_12412:330-1496(-)|eukprot:CAMPEP_0184523378 /NCGR_PEP_ID=MMETSP0198_2-20121128/8848_1 /TAXON_ID=1112570 /ORGANISM="Thraustochytrium sp., Strain LLF1b" /LENGTH=388 /DNA_ID=CAMNT_0026914397 /DNA_START=547 /DNA_END=1713 /DNA_ORIENTATION=-